jgi:ADP-ribose pyrophosphatase YjhB (NUDIX family)
MNRRRRVYAYITNRGRLLVFRHTDYPEAGVQVPGGTVEAGESPETAVMREAVEETGLTDLELVRCLGHIERDMTPFGIDETQEAWFYHLRYVGSPTETWQHLEQSASSVARMATEAATDPIRFDFFWAELPHGVPELIALNGEMLEKLGTE